MEKVFRILELCCSNTIFLLLAQSRLKRQVAATENASAPAAAHQPSAVPVYQQGPPAQQANSAPQSQYPSPMSSPQQAYQAPGSMSGQVPSQLSRGIAGSLDPNQAAYSGSMQVQSQFGMPLHQSGGLGGQHLHQSSSN